jgi:hypothetical protein
MEVLTAGKAAKIAVKRRGGPRIKSTIVYDQLTMLRVGEAIVVTRREWNTKSPPYWSVNRVSRNRGSSARYGCKTLIDDTGWLITRIK